MSITKEQILKTLNNLSINELLVIRDEAASIIDEEFSKNVEWEGSKSTGIKLNEISDEELTKIINLLQNELLVIEKGIKTATEELNFQTKGNVAVKEHLNECLEELNSRK